MGPNKLWPSLLAEAKKRKYLLPQNWDQEGPTQQ